MNLLVVGASHRTAPVEILERLAASKSETIDIARILLRGQHVAEAFVLSTCNRTEIYAVITSFHGGLSEIVSQLSRSSGISVDALSGHLYVRHEQQAIRHVFSVAAGLDSMVAGEAQILGQLREAYDTARDHGFASRLLHDLCQQALRVGKRVHSEAHVEAAAPSIVSAALDQAESRWGSFKDANVLVIGAGAMGALSLAALRRRSAGRCLIANRDLGRANRLADAYHADAIAFDHITNHISDVDAIVTATGSPTPIVTASMLDNRKTRLLICDVAVPRDVATDVADLPGVTLIDVATLSDSEGTSAGAQYLEAAERILTEEIDAFEIVARSAAVAPTVAALRSRADEVVDAELARLRRRTKDMTDEHRAEVAHSVHRVVRQLLHQPTVRVRQLATEPGGEAYTQALRELFALEEPSLNTTDGNDVTEALRVQPVIAKDIKI